LPCTSAAALALVLLTGSCGGRPALVLLPQPVPIGHDAFEVRDVAAVDVEGDGDLDLVAASAAGLHYLRHEGRTWSDETPGTGLDRVAVVDRLEVAQRDLLFERGDEAGRLVWSGIGSWSEQLEDRPQRLPPPSLSVEADLDGDGGLDRAWIEGRHVRVALRDLTGVLVDVTTEVASDALPLAGPGRRLQVADVDADGDLDLLAVGGRLMVLINNGGRLEPVTGR